MSDRPNTVPLKDRKGRIVKGERYDFAMAAGAKQAEIDHWKIHNEGILDFEGMKARTVKAIQDAIVEYDAEHGEPE